MTAAPLAAPQPEGTTMRTSETIADLAAALAKAQGAFAAIPRDREVTVALRTGGGSYTFKYATFSAILDAVRPSLAANGLAVMQAIGNDTAGALVTTRIMHASGQWIESDTPVFVNGAGSQAFGSGVTYAKRYGLAAMLNVAPDEDDDGNAADGNAATMRARGNAVTQKDPIAAAKVEMGGGPSQYEVAKAAKAAKAAPAFNLEEPEPAPTIDAAWCASPDAVAWFKSLKTDLRMCASIGDVAEVQRTHHAELTALNLHHVERATKAFDAINTRIREIGG